MKYKLVASDLDGTMLDNNSNASYENLLAVSEITKKGVCFVPCSGRALLEIPDNIKNHKDIRFIIHSNGAVVYDKVTGERIEMCISSNLSKYILDVLNSCECHISIRHDGKTYVDALQQTKDDYDYFRVWKYHIYVIESSGVLVENFKEFCYSLDNVETICAYFRSDAELEECRKKLLDTGKLKVVESSPHNLEIFSINAGKDMALYKLCDKLGISYSDTISIGDSGNDIYITQASGLGLAVENACDELKDISDEIICSNEENAIEYVNNNYL